MSGSRLAVGAGILGVAVDLGYVAIMFDEAQRTSGHVRVVSLFVLGASTLAIVGGSALISSMRTRAISLGAATGGLLTAGVLGIFSIGLPLLIAGVLCASAWGRVVGSTRPVPAGVPTLSTIAAVAAGALLVLGVTLT